MKYMLFSYLILAIVMLFVANKMLEFKNHLTHKVLGTYYSQMEDINKESGMDIYNLDNKIDSDKPLKEQLKEAQEITY
jgi:hypothetical protein